MMPEPNQDRDAEVIPLHRSQETETETPETPETEAEQTAEQEPLEAELVPAEDTSTELVPARPRWGFNTRLLRRDSERGDQPRPGARVAPVALQAARVGGRAVYAVGAGHVSWAKRAAGGLTHEYLREQVRSARAAGDSQGLAEWHQRLADARAARLRFLRELPGLVAGVAKVVLLALLVLVAAALAGGAWAGLSPGGLTWSGWWQLAADVGASLAALATTAWPLLAMAALGALLVTAWHEGRRQDVPRWLSSDTAGSDESVLLTADGVVTALRHLPIPPLARAFKEGWVPKFPTSPVRDGDGFHTIVELPLGVTAAKVADHRAVLARNLHRAEVEVWPTSNEDYPGCLELWVANRGVLSKPAPAYPLLAEGAGDVFAGVPVGVTQRGDTLTLALVEANFVVGGQPGQGKSNFGRVVMLGAALDPLCVLHVYVFAGNGDFDAYAPRLSVYRKGADADTVAAGVESLRELYDEIARREHRLSELGASKVTRGIAAKHPDLRPLVAFYSECHVMFGSDAHGKDAASYATEVVRRGRKTGVICGFDTQSSRKDAIPPKLVELVTLNACFAVKSWRSNDGFLGDGSFASGVRATELRAGKDRGTCLLTGATDEAFELVKTHYLDRDDETGWDAATDVIARAVAADGGPAAELEQPREERELLADVLNVLNREDKTPATVARLLAETYPSHRPYRSLTGTQLAEQLTERGVKPGASKGTSYVRAERVRAQVGSNDENLP